MEKVLPETALSGGRKMKMDFSKDELAMACTSPALAAASSPFVICWTETPCAAIIKDIADYALKSDAAMVRCGGSCLYW